jgi:nitroreductase
MVSAANSTEAAILSRRAIRAFRPDPIPRATIEHLLDVAARSPSGTNMQPWRLIALAGEPLEAFRTGLVAAFDAGAEHDNRERPYYPTPLFEPYITRRRKIGWDLYGLLGIARGETDKMRAHLRRNLRFFEAPVGLICTIDRGLEIGSWIDFGMFLQTLAIAARARDIDSCHMAVFAEFPATIRRLLSIDDSETILCGMALGHEDKTAPANALRTSREPAASFATWRGW